MHRVLLVGAPRGGTTWIAGAMGRTAHATLVHEPDGTHDPFALRAKVGLRYHPMLDPDDEAPEYERLWAGAFAGGRPRTGARAALVQRVFDSTSTEERTAALAHSQLSWRLWVVAHTAQPLQAATGIEHTVVKSVNAAFSLDWIAHQFTPSVGLILRHPLDVLASWRDIGWDPPSRSMYDAIGARAEQRWNIALPAHDAPELERVAATVAAIEFELERAAVEHDDWVAIRHEDACVAPEKVLADVAARLGLEWGPSASDFVAASDQPGEGYATSRVSAEQPGRWRERLTPSEQDRAINVLARFRRDEWLDQVRT